MMKFFFYTKDRELIKKPLKAFTNIYIYEDDNRNLDSLIDIKMCPVYNDFYNLEISVNEYGKDYDENKILRDVYILMLTTLIKTKDTYLFIYNTNNTDINHTNDKDGVIFNVDYLVRYEIFNKNIKSLFDVLDSEILEGLTEYEKKIMKYIEEQSYVSNERIVWLSYNDIRNIVKENLNNDEIDGIMKDINMKLVRISELYDSFCFVFQLSKVRRDYNKEVFTYKC